MSDLDLTALREYAEKRRDGMKRVNGVYDNDAMLALLDYAEANRKGWGGLLNDFARMESRAEAAEAKVARVEALYEKRAQQIGGEDDPENVELRAALDA